MKEIANKINRAFNKDLKIRSYWRGSDQVVELSNNGTVLLTSSEPQEITQRLMRIARSLLPVQYYCAGNRRVI